MTDVINKKKDLLEYINNKTKETLLYLDTKLATELQEELEVILEGNRQNWVWNADEKVFFASSLIKVKFIRLASLGDEDVYDLISAYILDGLKIENYNLLETIGKKIKYVGMVDDQIIFMENLKKAIESCNQELGKGSIRVENKLYEPAVKNWINCYFNFPYKTALRTNLDEWNFVNQSEARRILDNDERKILLEVLKIYDSLRNYINEYQSLPESDVEDEVYPNLDLYKLPGFSLIGSSRKRFENVVSEDDVEPESLSQNAKLKINTVLPSVPAPKNMPSIAQNFDMGNLSRVPGGSKDLVNSQNAKEGKPIQKPMGEIQKAGISRPQSPSAPALGGQGESENRKPNVTAQAGIKEDTTSPPVSVASMGIGSAMGQARIAPERKGINDRKMDVDDMDGRPGLKMWNSAPPQMPKQPATNNRVVEISSAEVVVENTTSDTSAKIDKKLEELEKRIK